MKTIPGLAPLKNELSTVKWRQGVQLGVIVLLALALVYAMWVNARLADETRELARHQPIRVVPGAAAGVYAPGLTNENVLNAIRYLQQLGANVTPATAKARFAELEASCAPSFLPKFRAERDRRLEEITQQAQSRLFTRDGEEALVRDHHQVYHYTVAGAWEIHSGSVPMSDYRHEFRLHFTVGTPDARNPYGLQLLGFDTIQLDPAKREGAAAATGTP
jgi:hypothetical protein